MTRKKVSIIGAGPAGLFAARELAYNTQPEKVEITVFEKGKDITTRDTSEKLYGLGGAGTYSDGKFLFDKRIGCNLHETTGDLEVENLIHSVEEIIKQYVSLEIKETSQKSMDLQKKANQNGIDFICPRQGHVGTDQLPDFILRFKQDLESKGVKFRFETEIFSLNEIAQETDYLILSPGRVGSGSGWMKKILDETGIEYRFRAIDIGVRIEVPYVITSHITEITRDMKFYIKTPNYRDKVRTFCTCPNGLVSTEEHEGFVNVNGHSPSQKVSENTNFAILVTIPLTQPLSDTNKFAKNIAQAFYDLGGGKPIAQRWGDLIRNHRSKDSNALDYSLCPTLKNVTWGDISLAMPGRYITDLIESIEKLNTIMPGLTNDETILYAPEIKFHGLQIPTDEFLQTNQKGIYVAGDGSGISRGIVGAAASGILAAKGILREI